MSSPERINEALQWFSRARLADRLAHAYLVIGSPTGDARIFVDKVLPLLLCKNNGDLACGVCPACRHARENRHQDIQHIEPQGKSRTIPVAAMRALQRWFGQTSLSGSRKIAVIWGAERLGDEAANAFLKTLEEPPSGSIFFLVTPAPSAVLPTVVSRCQRLGLSEPEIIHAPEKWVSTALTILEDLERREGIETAAWNAFAASQRFLALTAAIRKEIQQEETEAAAETDDKETVAARTTSRFKEQRARVLQILLMRYRDILLAVCGAEKSVLCYGEKNEIIKHAASGLRLSDVIRKIDTVEKLHRNLESNIPEAVAVHTAFAYMANADRKFFHPSFLHD